MAVMITGASSGIGLEVAKVFAQAGYHLVLIARKIERVKSLNLPNALLISADVTDFLELKNELKQVSEPIDCLINNAGIGIVGDFNTISHAEHEHIVDVNLTGVINCLSCVLPQMQQRRTGTIINISSVADRSPRPKFAVYAATKAAIRSLSESLRVDNVKYGIRVTNLAPAKVNTPMLQQTYLSAGDLIDAKEFAKLVLWIYQLPQQICIRDMVVAPTSYDE